uniref:granzyme E n=1 Tax=Lonchura striata TaxID=40157 RepID=UPI00129398BA|nr:granzyme E [Lonchura striata domestica]
MELLLPLLLPLLLVMCPPASSNCPWIWRERGGEARATFWIYPTPYVAFLLGKDNQSCGGFLVAPGWVMTAAQCLVHKPLTVILGAQGLQGAEESMQIFQVKEYHSHPGFKSPKKGNDILLLKLNGNATSNGQVRPISFEKSKVRGGTECSVAGWGNRTATVTIIKQRDCLSHYPGLAENLVCGRSKSSVVPMKGDAGDPLVCNNRAFGIFSYRHNNWPGFYTHIAPYLPWVHSVMKSS